MADLEDVQVKGYVKAVTKKAFLFDYGDKEEWFPLSQIAEYKHDKPAVDKENEVEITIPGWLASKKGLI